jgi:hypothetical protein
MKYTASAVGSAVVVVVVSGATVVVGAWVVVVVTGATLVVGAADVVDSPAPPHAATRTAKTIVPNESRPGHSQSWHRELTHRLPTRGRPGLEIMS